MFYYYFDRYYWILIVPAMLFAMWAQTKVNSTYNRYNRVYSARGMSAAQVCRQILDENGLFHIRVEHVSGKPSVWQRTKQGTRSSMRWDMSPSR